MDWSITSGANSGIVIGSGTANLTSTFVTNNSFGYDIYEATASGLDVTLGSSTPYWLNLQNATTQQGNPLYSDEQRARLHVQTGLSLSGFV